jgi:hypothetical protein
VKRTVLVVGLGRIQRIDLAFTLNQKLPLEKIIGIKRFNG